MDKIANIPIIGVMGSGRDKHIEKCTMLGKWIAESGYHLLTGGGGGVMSAVSRAFCEIPTRKGMSIGIIPGDFIEEEYRALEGYPNPWIDIPIFTHLPFSGTQGTSAFSRNHINILTSHFLVALPGGEGTKSEIQLALKYNKMILGFFKDSNEIFNEHLEIECIERFDNLTSRIKKLI